MAFYIGQEIQAQNCHKELEDKILIIKEKYQWGVIAEIDIPYKGKIRYRLKENQYRKPDPIIEYYDDIDDELFFSWDNLGNYS